VQAGPAFCPARPTARVSLIIQHRPTTPGPEVVCHQTVIILQSLRAALEPRQKHENDSKKRDTVSLYQDASLDF